MKSAKSKKRPHRRYGWHIVAPDRCLSYGDGRLVRVGKTLSVDGSPRLCHYGMHAAPTIRNCMFGLVVRNLAASAEPWLCRVVVGHASRHREKFVGKSRRVVWMCRLTQKLLRRAAKAVGLKVERTKQPKVVWDRLWSWGDQNRPRKTEAWFVAYAKSHGCPKKGLDQ